MGTHGGCVRMTSCAAMRTLLTSRCGPVRSFIMASSSLVLVQRPFPPHYHGQYCLSRRKTNLHLRDPEREDRRPREGLHRPCVQSDKGPHHRPWCLCHRYRQLVRAAILSKLEPLFMSCFQAKSPRWHTHWTFVTRRPGKQSHSVQKFRIYLHYCWQIGREKIHRFDHERIPEVRYLAQPVIHKRLSPPYAACRTCSRGRCSWILQSL